MAEETLAVSLEAARWAEAIKALRVILAVAIQADDAAAAAHTVHSARESCGNAPAHGRNLRVKLSPNR
ncbi:hypothetical protein ACPPVO_22510 [Dactylosporangium sp. McL0621]|uniref:hypothetical protein n=1 Tax=Dactylosporangium sp. McL0621 TaxID=3415678 RepID=UPI003CE7467B